MRTRGASLTRRAGIACVLVLALLVTAFRPLTQSESHAGVRRMALHSQAVRDDGLSPGAPAILDVHTIDLPRAVSIPRLIAARTESHPVTIRPHLKLPSSRADDPLLAL
jgi:hypothetical protein